VCGTRVVFRARVVFVTRVVGVKGVLGVAINKTGEEKNFPQ
jgi:hypothetical protein